jgi:NitT/TauT family transport system substrate-binding protein
MKFKILSGLLVFSLLMVGCVPSEDVSDVDPGVMTTAFQYWPGQYWMDVAMEKGWFEEAGLNVEFSFDANEDFQGSQVAMANGELVVHQIVFFDFIRFIIDGKDLIAVANSDVSFGGDMVVARGGINSVADLKGMTVGVDKGSFLEFILASALDLNGLSFEDIILVQARAEDVDKIISGEVDALLTWEPHATKVLEATAGKVIFDTSQVPGLVPDVITFNREYVENHPENVQAYVNVWHKTTKYMKSNEDEAFSIIAKKYGVSLEDVKEFAEVDRILDLSDNKIAFTYAAGFESLHGTAKQINNFMKQKGITDKNLDSTEFIDASFIRGVKE